MLMRLGGPHVWSLGHAYTVPGRLTSSSLVPGRVLGTPNEGKETTTAGVGSERLADHP
jgi:hypothetical protein